MDFIYSSLKDTLIISAYIPTQKMISIPPYRIISKKLKMPIKVVLDVDDITQYVSVRIKCSHGAKCSAQGGEYERLVAGMCRSYASPHQDIPLNTQTDQELGGCTAKQDVTLNFNGINDVGVEVKRVSPDWMQMKVLPDGDTWIPSPKAKIPKGAQDIFMSYIEDIAFPVPPFLKQPISYAEWMEIKTTYKDRYHRVPDTCIANAYQAKGSHYIQLRGYGLYHTGTDVCNFEVPLFSCEQYIRVRCKRHGKKDALGNAMPSSVMMSFSPKIKTLPKSPYSLDNAKSLPRCLRLLRV